MSFCGDVIRVEMARFKSWIQNPTDFTLDLCFRPLTPAMFMKLITEREEEDVKVKMTKEK